MNVLVAGIGNIFFGDDGFGPEVARLLAQDGIAGVKIEDYGIRGLHLAYELSAGYDRAFLIDAVGQGGVPGTLYRIEPGAVETKSLPDAHRMDLENVLAFLRVIGGVAPPITLIGCEPARYDEGIGLSAPVRDMVAPAADFVRRLVAETLAAANGGEKGSTICSEA
ncbi:MAG TPA: hydrogenase maturation protease [Candidatus Cybelea sp.]|nr:hydrogenase maturation protease [Candidatus Cybelea sp.]